GDKFVYKEFGETIERVSKNGVKEFYEGFVADSLDTHMKANGGLLRKADLVNYKPKPRTPLVSSFKGYKMVTMPPPSSGGIALIQLLKLFENLGLRDKGHNSADTIDLMCKALGPVYKARDLIADPDFESVDTKKLTSDAFIKGLQGQAYGTAGARRDGSQTTHLSVIDGEGNVVALTESLECFFGCGIVVPGTGMFLNDTMHDFDPVPGRINSVAPGKRPKSSMSPTIFFKDNKPVLVLGSAAGPRIITAVLQVALNVLEHGMTVQEAIGAPRFHFQGGKRIRMEGRIPQNVRSELERRGYELEVHPDYTYLFGGVHAISAGNGELHGGADPRRDGGAVEL
ncbi:MAG: gamma-glutamyltransferase, partial [SAR202 cluster bacterium]|nr:gamma-glutamyltransferase [SAR202 cluster bacterium]